MSAFIIVPQTIDRDRPWLNQFELDAEHEEGRKVEIWHPNNTSFFLRADKAFQAMRHAQFIASTYSKDPRTKVGALVLAADWSPISWGYNGFPRGTRETLELWMDREAKYKRVRHAEANALDTARHDTHGASIFCTLFPCAQCAGQIIQKGITRVFYIGEPREDLGAKEAFEMFADAGVLVFNLKG